MTNSNGPQRDNAVSWSLVYSAVILVTCLWLGTLLLFDLPGSGVTFSAPKKPLSLQDYWQWRGTFGDMFGAVNSIFTALTVVGVAVSIVLQRKQIEDAKRDLADSMKSARDSADAAISLVKITERMHRHSLRPFLLPERTELVNFKKKKAIFRVKVLFRNSGGSAALKCQTFVRTYYSNNEDPNIKLDPPIYLDGTGIVAPGSLIHNYCGYKSLTNKEFRNLLRSENGVFFVYGYTQFETTFGERFRVHFRRHMSKHTLDRGFGLMISDVGNHVETLVNPYED